VTLTLRKATLIDGTGREPIANAVIVVDGEKIAAVGQEGQVTQPPGEVINLAGKTVLPGLLNMHEHLELRRGLGAWQEKVAQSDNWAMMRAVRNALLCLQEGVTTVRDLGSRRDLNLALKRGIEEGMIIGPRMVTCGQPLVMTGGHGWEICTEADGPDEARKAARQQLKAGADLIKAMASGGYISYIKPGQDQPWSSQLTVEEMRAAFEEAKKAGKKTTVHAHPPAAIRAAIEAGVDCIEHGVLLDKETAELMASKGIFLVPTLAESWEMAEHGLELGRPAWLVEASKAELDSRLERFAYAVDAGVKIAMGTDVAGSPAREIELMAKGGLSSMEAIVAATRNGAELIDMGDQIGTIEAGKLADLTVVDGNPLEDLLDLAKVELVFKGGTLYRPQYLAMATGRYPL
jgi:imidazolonepropionase-like amidohydrolase